MGIGFVQRLSNLPGCAAEGLLADHGPGGVRGHLGGRPGCGQQRLRRNGRGRHRSLLGRFRWSAGAGGTGTQGTGRHRFLGRSPVRRPQQPGSVCARVLLYRLDRGQTCPQGLVRF
uniref:(northern house mosquito) hypothetical protein n=1 Tax=Culex pipiens TaxID=7175 RepID=A0A8D8I9P9_CULPI